MLAKSILAGALAGFTTLSLVAAGVPAAPAVAATPGLHAALSDLQWAELGTAVDRGLAWTATQQQSDGSFGDSLTPGSIQAAAQPALTSLAVMAYLSRGHLPGYGPYGEALNKAVDFVVSCQMPDGLFSYQTPGPEHQRLLASGNATYNHAIAGLMLGEVYGHVTGPRMKEVRLALDKALAFTRDLQTRPKANPEDTGGWRYLRLQYGRGNSDPPDSDMSVTSWQLMFLRSARNAEFKVPQRYIEDAMNYVHRSFDGSKGIFYYVISGDQAGRYSRGLVGAGIVSLSLAGEHQSPMALAAGTWLLDHPFRTFGEQVGGGGGFGGGGRGGGDNFYYSTYYCSQAAAQLGGRYWEQIFPPLAEVLLGAQTTDGSWPVIGGGGGFGNNFGGLLGGGGGRRGGRGGGYGDAQLGRIYPTAMAILSLTPAYQLLPVYQR